MAITVTSTGSQWHMWRGTEEEVVNNLMVSGIGTVQVRGFDTNAAGSAVILLNY